MALKKNFLGFKLSMLSNAEKAGAPGGKWMELVAATTVRSFLRDLGHELGTNDSNMKTFNRQLNAKLPLDVDLNGMLRLFLVRFKTAGKSLEMPQDIPGHSKNSAGWKAFEEAIKAAESYGKEDNSPFVGELTRVRIETMPATQNCPLMVLPFVQASKGKPNRFLMTFQIKVFNDSVRKTLGAMLPPCGNFVNGSYQYIIPPLEAHPDGAWRKLVQVLHASGSSLHEPATDLNFMANHVDDYLFNPFSYLAPTTTPGGPLPPPPLPPAPPPPLPLPPSPLVPDSMHQRGKRCKSNSFGDGPKVNWDISSSSDSSDEGQPPNTPSCRSTLLHVGLDAPTLDSTALRDYSPGDDADIATKSPPRCSGKNKGNSHRVNWDAEPSELGRSSDEAIIEQAPAPRRRRGRPIINHSQKAQQRREHDAAVRRGLKQKRNGPGRPKQAASSEESVNRRRGRLEKQRLERILVETTKKMLARAATAGNNEELQQAQKLMVISSQVRVCPVCVCVCA
jgi:hypothetical protein